MGNLIVSQIKEMKQIQRLHTKQMTSSMKSLKSISIPGFGHHRANYKDLMVANAYNDLSIERAMYWNLEFY